MNGVASIANSLGNRLDVPREDHLCICSGHWLMHHLLIRTRSLRLWYMMKSLTDLGMTYIHLSPDMHLYIQAMQIKLNEPHAFDKLILRPGVMHIVQNVCGCIGQLMMGSGLADLIGSAFGGVGRIMAQGKPWVRAMRSFRMVSSVLLQSLLQTGFKTCDEICEYLEKTRLTSYKPSLGGQPHHSDSPHSPVALSTALHSTSPPVFFHRWPPQLCKIPLMALPRNGYTISCHGKGWPTLWSICLQTQGGQLECSVGRPVRGADGNKDWERWTEGHDVIPGTSGGMDRLIFHISIHIRSSKQL